MSPKAMRKRVFGIGIIATGLLVLAISLIIGLEFPKYVWKRNIDNVCIVDKQHPKFEVWVGTVVVQYNINTVKWTC